MAGHNPTPVIMPNSYPVIMPNPDPYRPDRLASSIAVSNSSLESRLSPLPSRPEVAVVEAAW